MLWLEFGAVFWREEWWLIDSLDFEITGYIKLYTICIMCWSKWYKIVKGVAQILINYILGNNSNFSSFLSCDGIEQTCNIYCKKLSNKKHEIHWTVVVNIFKNIS